MTLLIFYTNQDPELAYSCIEGMQSTGIRSVFIRTFQDTGEEYGMPSIFIEPAEKAMHEVEQLTGTLEVGKKADMILFDPRHLKSFPDHDAEAAVVYASSEENIDTTIVNGKIVYHRGTFAGGLSEKELIREIDAELAKMKAEDL
jgi:cytosine/adenosine deaminase-related metal-dependent hydrolase